MAVSYISKSYSLDEIAIVADLESWPTMPNDGITQKGSIRTIKSLQKGKSPFLVEAPEEELHSIEEVKEPELSVEIRNRGYNFGAFSFTTENF